MPEIKFSSPDFDRIDLLIIAGEASGDEHSSLIVGKIKERLPKIKLAAIGGRYLEKKGAHLVYPLVDHAVVGVFEVLKNYSLFKKIFSKTISWIKKYNPEVILLVDYPGFNLRLAKELKKQGLSTKGGGEIKVLQYISPQLWAWKSKRRFEMEKILDSLGVLFPFEVECYQDTKLNAFFVGHPFADRDYNSPFLYDPNGPLLMLPGSREQAVGRILPSFLQAYQILLRKFPQIKAKILVPSEKIRNLVMNLMDDFPNLKTNVEIIEKISSLKTCGAWMSSGTMSLACAFGGIPGVIAYRAHPMTYLLGKFLVKIPYLGMANILLRESPPYPEFIQGKASGKNLSLSMESILKNDQIGLEFEAISKKLVKMLKAREQEAVDWILQETMLG